MNTQALLAGVGLAAGGGLLLYHTRRRWIAALLKLPPPLYDVTVDTNLRAAMPDGVHLVCDHYAPRARGDFPTVLIRTPYDRKRNGIFAQRFAERGYHVVVQDTRGRFESEGTFSPYGGEDEDGAATATWLVRQPWFNGQLGTWGASYLGYVQWALAAAKPGAVQAMVPVMIGPNPYEHIYPDGAFGLEGRLTWARALDFKANWSKWPWKKRLAQTRDMLGGRWLKTACMHLPLREADVAAMGQPNPVYRELLQHPHSDDPYWQQRDHSAAAARLATPVHLIGGWHDYSLRGTLSSYCALQAAGHTPYLTIGPWSHTTTGAGALTTQLGEGLRWMDAHLKGQREKLRENAVRLYVMGANAWREFAAWPPPGRETRYYLHAAWQLAPEKPPVAAAADGYRYDPADPTPDAGAMPTGSGAAGQKDNRALEARADVLCYTSTPLPRAMEVIGPVRAELYVRSSCDYFDFCGRLCDVQPDGRSLNVCDGLLRVSPGVGERQADGSLRVEVDLWATAYRFQAGHRLRLQLASGAHPRWNRNLGTGEPLAEGTRMVVAEQTVYHDQAHPSAIVLPAIS
jgi:putative CocE/NonD family hydrolase